MSKSLIELVKSDLKNNGYDGLFHSEIDCACKLDDLAPCGEIGMECCAGYYQESDEYGFIIGKLKDENGRNN
jgi:hypothetical protein